MRIQVTAPDVTQPTFETVESLAKRRFQSTFRLLRHMTDTSDSYLHISVSKEGDIFVLNVELHAFEKLFVKSKHRDLRIALRNASQDMRRVVKKARER